MKVVIGEEGMGRYAGDDGDNYLVEVQDTYPMSKKGSRVEEWFACDGKGIVYLKEPGCSAAYEEPSESSTVVGELIYDIGCVPDTYPCLGYADGWFKTDLGGTICYINEEYVEWDAIDSF